MANRRERKLNAETELARIRGNIERLLEYWSRFTEYGIVKILSQQVREIADGKPLTQFFPDCIKCEEDGNPECPWYGEPDGCNNRDMQAIVMKQAKG